MAKFDKNIDSIFDECLEGVLSGQTTIEQCLKEHPEQAAELEPLLRTALSINNAVAIQPDAQLKARGRYQLQLKMAQLGKPRRAPLFGWQPRWATGIMTAMLVFTVGGGTVLAADGSMPGSPLYPIKIATENVRVSLAGSEVEKEALLAQCADRRVSEIEHVVAKGNVDAQTVADVADRYIQQVDRMSGMVSASVPPAATGTDVGILTAPEATSQAPESTPPSLTAGQTPETAGQPTAQETGRSREKQPSKASSQADDTETLKVTIISYAVSHPEQIQKLLDNPNVPEQAKLALRRMLHDAKEKYTQTIKDLERQQGSSHEKGDD